MKRNVSPADNLTEGEMATIVAYLDGTLSDDQRTAFEQRLRSEPALLELVDSSFAMEDLLQGWGSRPADLFIPATRRLWIPGVAAALILVAAIFSVVHSPPAGEEFRIALVAARDDFLVKHPELAGIWPIDQDRGLKRKEELSPVSMNLLTQLYRTEVDRALEHGVHDASFASFHIAIELPCDASVVAFSIEERREVRRLFPEGLNVGQSPGPEQAAVGFLVEGTHVLAPNGDPLGMGFISNPSVRSTTILVGYRETPISTDLLRSLDESMERTHTVTELRTTLEQHGITVANELHIVED